MGPPPTNITELLPGFVEPQGRIPGVTYQEEQSGGGGGGLNLQALMGLAELFSSPDTGETAREAQRALGASLRGRQGLATPEGPPASEAIQAGPQAPPTGPQWIGPPDARYRVESGGPGTPEQAVAQLGAYRRRQGPEDVEQVGGRTLIYGGAPTQPRLIPAEEDAVMTARVQLQAALDVQRQMHPGAAIQYQAIVDQRIKQLQAAQAAQSAIQAPTPRELHEGQGAFGGLPGGKPPAGAGLEYRKNPKTGQMELTSVRTATGGESSARAEAVQMAVNAGLDPRTPEGREFINKEEAKRAAAKAGAAREAGVLATATPEALAATKKAKQAGAEGTTMGGAIPGEVSKDIATYQNTERLVNSLNQFRSEEINEWIGIARRPAQEIARYAQGNARYEAFRATVGALKGTAFGEGGKQLTPFEAAVVFLYTPGGDEPNIEAFMAKTQQLKERVQYLREQRIRLLKTTRGNVDEALLDTYEKRFGDDPALLSTSMAIRAGRDKGLEGDQLEQYVRQAADIRGGGFTPGTRMGPAGGGGLPAGWRPVNRGNR